MLYIYVYNISIHIQHITLDWQAGAGEMYEGIIVNDIRDRRTGKVARAGNPDGRIAFGAVGAADVADTDEVFIVIAPQSMVGASVYEPLSEMVTAANGRPVILINPRLQDRKSAGGVMGVGGRSQRLAFVQYVDVLRTTAGKGAKDE